MKYHDPMRRALLTWYRKHARDLPWRKTRDPYAIWVSEIMCQQTRVDTVIPYYERFLSRFPNPKALAAASEDEVLSLWSGLGYYRRARLLHQGVRELVAQYGGAVPEDPEGRRSLPGVGRYTAGAIGSIAFGRCEPVVDGNVARVLCRYLGIQTPLGDARTEKRLWAEATRFVEGPDPGDFNQAVMELGALVCTPREPDCGACPLRRSCVAHRTGCVGTLPVPKKRAAIVRKEVRVALPVLPGGEVILHRGEAALFGGLWAPVSVDGADPAKLRDAVRSLGIDVGPMRAVPGEVRHVLSHRDLRLTVHRGRARGFLPSERVRAFLPADLERVGVSTLTQKLLAHAGWGTGE
ncbi:MAG: A/G-specific adenine glycosylase [Myxococcales bacterium]|nr:A/G-specific adenine glycosylase [Myxococcales bacterium]